MIGSRLSRVWEGAGSNGSSNGSAGTTRHGAGRGGAGWHHACRRNGCQWPRLLATLSSLVSFTSFS